MKHEDFLVTTSLDNRNRKRVWNTSTPLWLDHPPTWALEKKPHGIFIERFGVDSKPLEIAISDVIAQGGKIKIPREQLSAAMATDLTVSVRPLEPIRAAFQSARKSVEKADLLRPHVLMLFSGIRYLIIGYQTLGSQYEANFEGITVFKLKKLKNSGYELECFQPNVRIKSHDGKKRDLPVGTPYALSEQQLPLLHFSWGAYWWKFNRVPTPEVLPLEQMEQEEASDRNIFRRLVIILGLGLLALCFLLEIYQTHPRQEDTSAHQTELKKPKVVELKLAPPKPKPLPTPVPTPPPLKKVTPKPVVATKKSPAPVPPKIKTVTPPKVEPPPPDPAKIRAQKVAEARAELAKSLSFLSPNAKKSAPAPVNSEASVKHYDRVGKLEVVKDNLTSTAQIPDDLTTKNAREVKADYNAKAKALNDVQGRVQESAIHSGPNAGTLVGAIQTAGLSVSGVGKVSDSEVEKALSKHLNQFQYCYEKSLLSDSHLAGLVLMEWSISSEGKAHSVKVIRSEMNNAALKNCLSKEIETIAFPHPSGGEAVIRYPFKFSSSPL